MRKSRETFAGDADAHTQALIALYEVALENTAHGLCMYDAEGRVALFNRRFLEIYGLSADVVRRGMSTRELLEHSAACGNIPPDKFERFCETYAQRLSAGVPFQWKNWLSDGRVIGIDYRPMTGGGWVGVFQDITEPERLERELRLQVERMNHALSTMPYGLAMFGPDERLIVANDRYREMYDIDPSLLKRGTKYRDIMATSFRKGLHPNLTLDELYNARMGPLRRGETATLELEISDGRVIQSTCRPSSDGGWVADHQDITERRRFETALRKQNMLLDTALETMPYGICVFDSELRVLAHNKRFLEIYGYSPDIVKPGATLRDITRHSVEIGSHPQHTPESLFEDVQQNFFVHQNSAESVVHRRLSGNRIVAVRYRPTASGGWVGTYEDVTERERAADLLREQNLRFDEALKNMGHGLCMFDKNLRVVVCNRRYPQDLELDPEATRPGTLLLDILREGVNRGNYPGGDADAMFADYKRRMIENGDELLIRRFASGRVVAIRHRPMSDGNWIVTTADITEQEAAADKIRQQNVLFDAALENMAHGLCMFDKNLRLVVCNKQFLEMYALNRALVKPGTALLDVIRISIAQGRDFGRTAEEMYAEVFQRIEIGQPFSLIRKVNSERIHLLCYQPLADGWVITYEDITERERTFQALEEQHRRFDAALENMAQGLCMFDDEMRVIVYNQRYLELFSYLEETVQPGTHLLDVMKHAVRTGHHENLTAEQLYARFLEGLDDEVSTNERRLADGRIIMITRRRMTHGGFVATYEDVTERRKTEERIAHMASHDALTGLPNRTLFREKMDQGLARVEAEKETMALLCLDLDNFKGINDALGHPIGDKLLENVAARLVKSVGPDDTVARLGGDEFAILQIGLQPQSADVLARRLVDILSHPDVIDGHEINIGVSIGIAIAPVDGTTPDHLMKCADLALYRAKADGRGVYRFFEQEMDARIQARRTLEIDLRKALINGEFSVVYQPLVRASTGQLTGFEALLRWRHPERGSVSPAEFIPLAEDIGLIGQLGEWVLRKACEEAAAWPSPIKIAVNLSPLQLRKRGFVTMVANALAATGVSPTRLELEITEAALLQDDDVTMTMLHQLRALGIRISLDDFGTGYSSLSYLRSFPFDKIKIDRSFVAHLGRRHDGDAIIRAIAGLGTSLGVDTTAEGVETKEQLDLVRQYGCTEVQGYYISQPLPASEIPQLIASHREAVAAA